MFPYYSSPAIRLCYNSRAGSLSPNYLNCAIAQLLNIVSAPVFYFSNKSSIVQPKTFATRYRVSALALLMSLLRCSYI